EAMRRFSFPIPGISVVGMLAISITSAGCDNNQADDVNVEHSKSVTTPQTPLSGNSVAKFVDALPQLSGNRSDGTTRQRIVMQEFQQKVLPNAFYNTLSGVNRNGTFLWGYNINGRGASFP